MKYVPRDIRQIKLVTGDEILTEVIGEDHVEFLIRNPLKVFKEKFTMNGLSREANFFTRWMGFADNQEFIINKQHIVVEALVDDSVAEYYNKMMANIEQDDSIHMGSQEDAEHPELLETEPEEEDLINNLDKPLYH
jgi:hypothetical protein